MIVNLEKIFNFVLYFYNLDLFLHIYNRKNFFIGKLGFINFFMKKFIKNNNCFLIFNFYKKFFLKIFFIKSKFIINDIYYKFFNNYNYIYNKKNIKFNKINFIIIKLKNIFINLGFKFIYTNEIDFFENNFQKLNISKFHPSSSFIDSFYLNNYFYKKILLRTHTSNFQSRIKYYNIPLKIFTIGKVYRPDNDNLHLPIFTQLDILWIDKFVNFFFLKNFFLKFIIYFFLKKKFFYKFRSAYFPFTYLSKEVDLLLNKKKWIEFCGMGIIYPKIFYNLNINSFIYKGFALGLGIERLAMIYYNVDNLNYF
ncbi:Phenylalanine--tRNA ligase [Candidatus Nasuia deltocephalinicola]|nr:Phenylalanine--tRNA ligase [Candidatus Nasuia deltocephalinicola]